MSSDPAVRVRVHQIGRELELQWADTAPVRISHARLRRVCKCAWCEQARRRDGCDPVVADTVALTGVAPMGQVGLQMSFSDGHDRGIYPWAYLRELTA